MKLFPWISPLKRVNPHPNHLNAHFNRHLNTSRLLAWVPMGRMGRGSWFERQKPKLIYHHFLNNIKLEMEFDKIDFQTD